MLFIIEWGCAGNYGAPPGFMFDWGQLDEPIMDNICSRIVVMVCRGLLFASHGDRVEIPSWTLAAFVCRTLM